MQTTILRKIIFATNRQRRKRVARLKRNVKAGMAYVIAEIKAQAFLS